MAEWRWVQCFADQLRRCRLTEGEVVAVLSESSSRPELVETARLAVESLGGRVFDLVVPTPANDQPVAIRSTGASQALQGNPAVLAGLAAAGLVVDCTVEGLLHAPELGTILDGGARVLMISNEHPETFERLPFDPTLAARVDPGTRPSGGGVDHAGHLRRRYGPDGAAGRRGDSRIDRRDRGPGLHRPLARRPGAGVPRAGDRGRHRRARARRPQPHVQALPRAPCDPDHHRRPHHGDRRRRCRRRPLPFIPLRVRRGRGRSRRTPAPTWAGASTTRPGGISSSSTTSGT